MMADLEIGNDGLLTTSLATNDRITITRAANNQELATMTVEEFMKKCASMMPVATATDKGLMSAADRGFHPAEINIKNHYIPITLDTGEFLKLNLVPGMVNAIITVSAIWNVRDTTGMIIKSVNAMGNSSQSSFVLAAVKKTADYVYISDVIVKSAESSFVYIANKDGKRTLVINISTYRGGFLGYEVVNSMEDCTAGLSNYTEYKNQ